MWCWPQIPMQTGHGFFLIHGLHIIVIRHRADFLDDLFISGRRHAEKGVAIACDSRRMSPEFADEAALCMAANGIKAYVFDALRPRHVARPVERRVDDPDVVSHLLYHFRMNDLLLQFLHVSVIDLFSDHPVRKTTRQNLWKC